MAEVYLGGEELPMLCVFCGESVIRLQRIHYAIEDEREVCLSLPICKRDCLDSYAALVDRVRACLDTDWDRSAHRRHRMSGVDPKFARAYQRLTEQRANEWEAELAKPRDPDAGAGNAAFADIDEEDDAPRRKRRGRPESEMPLWGKILVALGLAAILVAGVYYASL